MRRAVPLLLGLLSLSSSAPPAARSEPPNAPEDGPIVLRVGDRTIRRGELEERLRRVPHYQLATFGDIPTAALRGFTQSVVVREALLDAESRRLGLQYQPDLAWELRTALAETLLASLEREAAAALTPSRVRRHFEEQRASYGAPLRLLLWRIVVPTREEAEAVIRDASGADGLATWQRIARESSEDRSNHLRGGALGLVDSQGKTEWPRLRVPPVLFAEASKVADGAIVPEPIEVDGRYFVVWRRGSVPAAPASFEASRDGVEHELLLGLQDQARTKLLAALRAERLHNYRPELAAHAPQPPLLDLEGPQKPTTE